MGVLWQIALSNAALVAAGVPIVWLIGRHARRPALTHGLAVLLLLKLITPPLWRVPISWPEDAARAVPAAVAVAISPTVPAATGQHVERSEMEDAPAAAHAITSLADPEPPAAASASASPISDPQPDREADSRDRRVPPPALIAAAFDWGRWIRQCVPIAGWAWAAGSALCALTAAVRIVRFTRALRLATPAPDVQPRADMLARRLGLRRAPAVWFVPAFVSPMLWSVCGRPRLLLPVGLWGRLGVAGRDTILLHELAHWRRGDPVVRWIELLATCLYWWHPACWWARRELREAEEQCCDAWVLWAIPGTFKDYANALLEAVEFASIRADRPSARRAVPALASRMGQFVHLRRRLTMLKHGNIARALSWGGLAGVMALGSIVLPLAPTWGQDRPAAEVAPGPGDALPGVTTAPPPFQAPPEPTPPATPAPAPTPPVTTPPATDDRRVDAQWMPRAKIDAAEAELVQARQTIIQLQRELQLANARLAELTERARRDPRAVARPDETPKAENPVMSPNPPGGADGPTVVRQEFHRVNPEPRNTMMPPSAPGGLATTSPPGGPEGEYRVVVTDPATGQVHVLQTRTMPTAPTAQSQSERLDKIEAELRTMMDEIAKMRQTPAVGAGEQPSRTAPAPR